jgi:hypothetical protein
MGFKSGFDCGTVTARVQNMGSGGPVLATANAVMARSVLIPGGNRRSRVAAGGSQKYRSRQGSPTRGRRLCPGTAAHSHSGTFDTGAAADCLLAKRAETVTEAVGSAPSELEPYLVLSRTT